MALKLYIQFPTRGRPNQFKKYLLRYMEFLSDIDNTEIHISCDIDDHTMNNDVMTSFIYRLKNTSISFNNNKNKVEAINRVNSLDWDILLLASDDMWPEIEGYDDIIRKEMQKSFPDLDGVLHFNDGIQEANLNTLAIVGKKYYDRFGFIYNPIYKSVYCDAEFQAISENMEKVKYIDKIIISHNRKLYHDNITNKNVREGKTDKRTWEHRKNSIKQLCNE